jgi:5-deoxy-D-glucuronate isomerase
MYPWSNERRLDTLVVDASEGVLTFSDGNDRATVRFDDSGITEVVVGEGDGAATITEPHHIVVGKENYERDVYHYLRPGGPAKHLRLGITKHKGLGTWSSLPHDFELHTEPGFEEVFFYLLRGASCRAIQRGKGVWHDGPEVDDAWVVSDRSWSTVPMGYHPVAAEPGVQVMYIWAYLAKKKEWEKI